MPVTCWQILHPVLQMKLRQKDSFVKLNHEALQRGRMGLKSLRPQGIFSGTLHCLLLPPEGINFLSFSGLKGFSPFSLDAKAQPLTWHYTTHGICPGRRLVGARLAMRSQSECWGWWKYVGSVFQGISDFQCVGLCVDLEHVDLEGLCEGKQWVARPCCMFPATSQIDMISCSMYLGALVWKLGSWEGGTTVCKSRVEQKAPAEDLLQRSACSNARHIVMWEPFRLPETPCTRRASSAMSRVKCLGRSMWSSGTKVMVITMAWAWDIQWWE